MSYEYLDDLFGEQVETSPKYVKVELKAIEMLWRIIYLDPHNLQFSDYDEIYECFESIREEYIELIDHTVEPGQPLWLSNFLSYHFLEWADWYMLRKAYTEQPEQFNSEELVNKYRKIEQMDYDGKFFEKCKYCFYTGKLYRKLEKADKKENILKRIWQKIKKRIIKN